MVSSFVRQLRRIFVRILRGLSI